MMSGPRRHQLKNRLVIVILHVVLRVAQQDEVEKELGLHKCCWLVLTCARSWRNASRHPKQRMILFFHGCVLN